MNTKRVATKAEAEAKPRGRFQLSLRQLVLVMLAAAGLLAFNLGVVGPTVKQQTYGWPFVLYVTGKARARKPSGRLTKGPARHSYAAGVGVESGGRATIGARRVPGLQFDGLILDPPFWFAVLALAWVLGDQSSLPRSVRDRLRKVKRRKVTEEGAVVGRSS